MEAVRQNGKALQFVSKECQAYKEIALEAVRQNWEALTFASTECQADVFWSKTMNPAIQS